MKNFYLFRHEDVHGNSGTGIVAEGTIYDNGLCSMTWLTPEPTMTMFPKAHLMKKIHGHEGKTEVIIEGKDKRFIECNETLKLIRKRKKHEINNPSDIT